MAMILAKSLIVSRKTYLIIAHLCSERAVFAKIMKVEYLPASLIDPIQSAEWSTFNSTKESN
jgi:hypothetical protein